MCYLFGFFRTGWSLVKILYKNAFVVGNFDFLLSSTYASIPAHARTAHSEGVGGQV